MNIALIDGTKVTKVGDYRTVFSNTSFTAAGPSDEFLAENNAMRVKASLPYDSNTEKLVTCEPYIDGDWVYTVCVEPLSAEELQARTDAKAAAVRQDRNRRLTNCDWTQLPDSPVDAAPWATYRQELRDITAQAGFPWDVVWPEEP